MNSVERLHSAPQLDLDALRMNLLRQKEPARVQIFEHGAADEVKDELGRRLGLTQAIRAPRGTGEFGWQRDVAMQRFIGSPSDNPAHGRKPPIVPGCCGRTTGRG